MAKEKFSLENLSQLSKEGMERGEEITEKLKQLPRRSKKAMKREEEITEKLKQLPHLKSLAGKETEEALKELRDTEKVKIKDYEEKEEQEKLREKLGANKTAGKEAEEAEWDEAIKKAKKKLEKEPEEKKSHEKRAAKSGSEMKKHLRANLLDYPELLQPEIKKNLQIIEKNEDIIERNEGNAKKRAQDKIKKAEEIIERAQAAVDDFADDLIKQYDTSHDLLMEKSRVLFGEQKSGNKKASGGLENELNALYQKKFGPNKAYSPEKKGLLGGIKGFFKDRAIKKALGDDWDEFQIKQSEYKQKLDFYENLLASHGKRFGRLEEALEAGIYFQFAPRGRSERLPGIRGR